MAIIDLACLRIVSATKLYNYHYKKILFIYRSSEILYQTIRIQAGVASYVYVPLDV
jgi:hypothetical protein